MCETNSHKPITAYRSGLVSIRQSLVREIAFVQTCFPTQIYAFLQESNAPQQLTLPSYCTIIVLWQYVKSNIHKYNITTKQQDMGHMTELTEPLHTRTSMRSENTGIYTHTQVMHARLIYRAMPHSWERALDMHTHTTKQQNKTNENATK